MLHLLTTWQCAQGFPRYHELTLYIWPLYDKAIGVVTANNE